MVKSTEHKSTLIVKNGEEIELKVVSWQNMSGAWQTKIDVIGKDGKEPHQFKRGHFAYENGLFAEQGNQKDIEAEIKASYPIQDGVVVPRPEYNHVFGVSGTSHPNFTIYDQGKQYQIKMSGTATSSSLVIGSLAAFVIPSGGTAVQPNQE